MYKYICYTDGSYKSSKNAGGWASIICNEHGKIIDQLYQGYLHTTNNRMEIMAVLETLRYFNTPSDITIISDSQYVINVINANLPQKWFLDETYTNKNLDLWFEMIDLLSFHKVTMVWTKGHSSNKMNNLADELAQFAARCLNLKIDEYTDNGEESGKPLVSESETQWSDGIDSRFENGKILYSLG